METLRLFKHTPNKDIVLNGNALSYLFEISKCVKPTI